jgi:hypothetical protein
MLYHATVSTAGQSDGGCSRTFDTEEGVEASELAHHHMVLHTLQVEEPVSQRSTGVVCCGRRLYYRLTAGSFCCTTGHAGKRLYGNDIAASPAAGLSSFLLCPRLWTGVNMSRVMSWCGGRSMDTFNYQ